jgi:hypothetical protein
MVWRPLRNAAGLASAVLKAGWIDALVHAARRKW